MDDARLPAERILGGLRPSPRLIVDRERLAGIRGMLAGDDFAAAALAAARRAADGYHGMAHAMPPEGDLRFTQQSLELVTTCALLWRLGGGTADLACARDRLLAICNGPRWKRENFLPIGELAFVLALGYDWLRDGLSEVDRGLIRGRIRDVILADAAAAYDDGDWWADSATNWSQECNGGVIAAALAIADSDPEIACALLPRAMRLMAHALDCYEPDGAWDEGAGYWHRATIYGVYALAALHTALGHDAGLSARGGLAGTATFLLASVGPTGLLARYADCSEDRRRRAPLPALLWLADRYGRPEYARAELGFARAHGPIAEHLWFYRPIAGSTPPLPLDHSFRGSGPYASMRSAWDDPRALFVWTKGGSNQVNHGHLDQGGFEVDALGQRWVRDLGTDDYGLPGYFDRRPGGRRWSWYRLNSQSHSVPLLDGADQEHAGIARITAFHPDPVSPRVLIDFSEAYKPAAAQARRGIMLVQRRAVLVQDDFVLPRPTRFTWAMTTDAEVAVAGATATLGLGGERMTATILAPAGAVFSVASAERPPPEAPNTGVRRLLVELPAVQGRVQVAVLLAPHWPDGGPPAPPAFTPLGRWF